VKKHLMTDSFTKYQKLQWKDALLYSKRWLGSLRPEIIILTLNNMSLTIFLIISILVQVVRWFLFKSEMQWVANTIVFCAVTLIIHLVHPFI